MMDEDKNLYHFLIYYFAATIFSNAAALICRINPVYTTFFTLIPTTLFIIIKERPFYNDKLSAISMFKGVTIGLGAYFCGAIIVKIFEIVQISRIDIVRDSILLSLHSNNRLLVLISIAVTGFIVPVFEEIAFRFFLFNGVDKINSKYSLLVTVIIFGLAHIYSFECFIFAIIVGFILTFFYKRYKDLFLSVIIHSTINCIGLIIGFMAKS